MMQHYKDSGDNLYAFNADENPKDWTRVRLIKITDSEAEKIREKKQTPTREEAIASAEIQKFRLLSEASEAIAPLQDAVDLDMATPGEESALKEWKKYRVMLNRVDTSLGADTAWPTPPASPAS